MAKTVEEKHEVLTDEQAKAPVKLTPEQRASVEEVLAELRALPEGTTLPMSEISRLIRKMPRRPRTWSSADDIRELRGPLPEDDPNFELVDGRYVPRGKPRELSTDEREACESVLRDLHALPKGTTLTIEEIGAFLRRLPKRTTKTN